MTKFRTSPFVRHRVGLAASAHVIASGCWCPILLLLLITTSSVSPTDAFLLDSPQVVARTGHHPINPSRPKTMCWMNGSPENDNSNNKIQTWNPLRLLVLRLGLTEPAATSPLNYGTYDGTFSCAYCGQRLFDSDAKYDSRSGWPSFWRTASEDSVAYKAELDGRLECKCKRCSSHLGHVFLDGPKPADVPQDILNTSPESDPRGKTAKYLPRFCVNGAALRYTSREEDKAAATGK